MSLSKTYIRDGQRRIIGSITTGVDIDALLQKPDRGGMAEHMRGNAAIPLLWSGATQASCVSFDVIRAWLGHVSLETTSRYAEITLRGKMAAVATCLPPDVTSISSHRSDRWRKDEELLKWLNSL